MLSILNCEAESKSVGTRIVEVRKSQCGRRERRSQLLGGFAGEFRSKSYADPAFPQVNGVGAAQHPRKTTQKSGTMAISGPIFCRTVQKSRNVDSCEQGGVAAHAHPLALRKCKREQGGGETFKMDAPPSPVHQAAFPLAPSQLSGPIIGACLDNFQYSLHLQCAAITGFTSHAGDCPHYRCRQSPLEPQSQLLEQSLVVDSDRCGHCLPYPIWVFG